MAETRDRALSIDAIANNAYKLRGARATREQRLSATRAAHRVLRRVEEANERANELHRQAKIRTEAALGRSRRDDWFFDAEFSNRLSQELDAGEWRKFSEFSDRIGWWKTTTLKGHLLTSQAAVWRVHPTAPSFLRTNPRPSQDGRSVAGAQGYRLASRMFVDAWRISFTYKV